MSAPDRIADIVAAAELEDGVAPLDEATWLSLRHDLGRVRRWERDDAFALLVGDELSLVVRPTPVVRDWGVPCWTPCSPTRTGTGSGPGRTPTTPAPHGWPRPTASTGCGSCG